jgi:hypothetical protein
VHDYNGMRIGALSVKEARRRSRADRNRADLRDQDEHENAVRKLFAEIITASCVRSWAEEVRKFRL